MTWRKKGANRYLFLSAKRICIWSTTTAWALCMKWLCNICDLFGFRETVQFSMLSIRNRADELWKQLDWCRRLLPSLTSAKRLILLYSPSILWPVLQKVFANSLSPNKLCTNTWNFERLLTLLVITMSFLKKSYEREGGGSRNLFLGQQSQCFLKNKPNWEDWRTVPLPSSSVLSVIFALERGGGGAGAFFCLCAQNQQFGSRSTLSRLLWPPYCPANKSTHNVHSARNWLHSLCLPCSFSCFGLNSLLSYFVSSEVQLQ